MMACHQYIFDQELNGWLTNRPCLGALDDLRGCAAANSSSHDDDADTWSMELNLGEVRD